MNEPEEPDTDGRRRASLRLAILGPGVLGLSLARWAAERGLTVALGGRTLQHATQALQGLEHRWDQAVRRGELTAEAQDAACARIHPQPSWAAAADGACAVLEALPEQLETKVQAWQLLDVALPPGVLRLTASSSLPLSVIRAQAGMAGPLVGFHLFVPVRLRPLVELVTEPDTPPSVLARAEDLAADLGLKVARVRDQAGYAASRMALAQGLEAMRLLESGAATAEALDALMVHGYGHPCGPLELSDRIGLGLRLTIAEGLFQATGEARYEPPEILRAMVARGATGRTAGLGFYPWNAKGERA